MYSHIRCTYGVLGRDVIKYTVMYGAYKRSWPTLAICKLCTLPLPRIADATYCRYSRCHVLQMPRIADAADATYCRCHVLQMQRMPRIADATYLQMQRMPRIANAADATYCRCHVLQMPRIADATYCRCHVLQMQRSIVIYLDSFSSLLQKVISNDVKQDSY